jgi:hypothetical protein
MDLLNAKNFGAVGVKDNTGTLVTEKTNRDAFLGEIVEGSGGTYL